MKLPRRKFLHLVSGAAALPAARRSLKFCEMQVHLSASWVAATVLPCDAKLSLSTFVESHARNFHEAT
jgi:hypothetical protein